VTTKRPQRLWVLALVGVGVLAITLLLDLIVPYAGPLDLIIRGAAMAAYLTTFLSILSSFYVRELVRTFGAPFLKIHHYATVAGLILMTAHPLAVAFRAGSSSVFVPVISSWYEFFLFGTVHGILLGANFALPAVRVIALLMALAIVRLFVLKRAAMAREKARRRSPGG
jgi:sulfoxide reductase heme-binding subunit YedZ